MAREVSSWCPACDTLLDACESCGRWLLPGTAGCPDPQCGSRVLPFLPQHTGRRWDGRGSAVGWTWPARWERSHPEYRAPVTQAWAASEPVHAAFAAHGRLFLWHGTNLISLDETAWTDHAAPAAGWRCPLGPAGRPLPGTQFSERIALAGSAAVLALERRYVQADLRQSGGTVPLEGGAPLAQVGGPGWWTAWSVEGAGPAMRLSRTNGAGHALDPRPVSVPPEAALAPGGRLVFRDGAACWPGRDGGVWRLDCASRQAARVLDRVEGLLAVWMEPDGPRSVRESLGQVSVGLSAPGGGRAAFNAPAGAGPLRGVYASRDHVLVVGERVVALDARTGERLHEALRPAGQWIDGALAPAADGEPRLLALTLENGLASLTALRMSSGTQDVLWRQPGAEPRDLLPVGAYLYVVHSRGVVRLSEA